MSTFDNVMRNIYKIFVAFVLAFSLTCCSAMYEEAMPSYEKTTLIRVGEKAPDFTVETIDGNSVTLSQLQGKTTLLIFFASWCPDCHKQLDAIEQLQSQFDSSKFAVLAISRGEKIEDVREYVAGRGYTFQVAVDCDSEVYSLYATQYVPRCFVIDSFGRVLALSVEYDVDKFNLLCDIISSQLTVVQ